MGFSLKELTADFLVETTDKGGEQKI